MGTGYTRNDTSNNIADGNIINAADFDGEYDAIEAAFNSSTGHTHDGTSAEGAPITVLGPSQEFVASSSEVKPSTNAGLDLGTNTLKFKDLYLDGTAYIDGLGGDILAATDKKIQFRDTAIFINSSADGQLDIDADTTIELNSPEVIATDNFRLKSDAAILTFGADNDVTVTHVADTGLDAKAASGFALKLQTGDTTIESGNTLGKISFNAPDEASGTDSILVGAEIEAAAEATFSSTVNSTALVFKTNDSAAATERVRIKSDGDVVFTGASANMTWDTSANSLDFQDGGQVALGSDDDLIITHSGSAGSITNATGDFTIDAAADIILDADGQQIFFKKGGTTFGQFGTEATPTNFTIESTVSDGDIVFKGNDGGSTITALTFDMSEAGKAIFNAGAELSAAVTITTANNDPQLILKSTDADGSDGPILDLVRDSASPADNDFVGSIRFRADDDAGNETQYADIRVITNDVSNTTEDGQFNLRTMVNGSLRLRIKADPTEIVFNEESQDLDFRVETDNSSATLFVHGQYDGVGIHTTSPISYANAQAVLFIEDNTSPAIALSDTGQARDWYMVAQGSGLFFNYADGSNTGSSTNVTEAFQISNSSSGVIFNDGGADRDFRIEGNNNANMLFVDAGNDKVLIGSGTSSDGAGTSAAVVYSAADSYSTTSITNAGLSIDKINNSGNGQISALGFRATGNNTSNNAHGRIVLGQPVASSHAARFHFQLRKSNGNTAETLRMDPDYNVFNDDGNDMDFRVESDSNSNMFHINAGDDRAFFGSGSFTTGLVGMDYNLDNSSDWYSDSKAVLMLKNSNANGQVALKMNNQGTNSSFIVHNTSGNEGFHIYDRTITGKRFSADSTETVINEDSKNLDFRVESDSNTHMIFVDAASNVMGINESSPQDTLHVGGTIVAGSGATGGGPVLAQKYGSNGGVGSGDYLGVISSHASTGAFKIGYGLMGGASGDNLSSYDNFAGGRSAVDFAQSTITFVNDTANSATTVGSAVTTQALLTMSRSEALFNGDANDINFRVKSDTNSNAIFLDAGAASGNGVVCIGTSDTSVAGNTGSARGINLNCNGYMELAAYQETVAYFNRMNNDGTIIAFKQDAVTEGTISVSGSTVSYNGFAGRHESSGIPTTTARGTVVSTIDELDEYLSGPKQGQTRTDHAKVEVSDSVGDPCVYGVVDDFTDDGSVNVVSVGIAPVRVTGACAKGDLLESNGDGTAKVQSDDIVRSKTIGKVTIGNSDTGVKLVSCVLYCG